MERIVPGHVRGREEGTGLAFVAHVVAGITNDTNFGVSGTSEFVTYGTFVNGNARATAATNNAIQNVSTVSCGELYLISMAKSQRSKLDFPYF